MKIGNWLEEGKTETAIILYVGFFVVSNLTGMSFFGDVAWAPYIQSNSNTAAPAGSAWVEQETLRWADGSTEYWISDLEGYSDGFEHSGAANGNSIASNSDWVIDDSTIDWSYDSGTVNQGTYSAYTCNGCSAGTEVAHKDFFSSNRKPSVFEHSYYETSTSTGHAVTLKDASGNRVLAIGTDNPQLDIYDASGWNDESGTCSSNYDTWYHVTVNIEWSAGTFTVDRSDGCSLGPYDLRNTNGVKSVYIEGHSGGFGDRQFDTWIDDIRFPESGSTTNYRFEKGSGQIAKDSSGNNQRATLGDSTSSESTDPTWATGKYGNALDFDGSDDYTLSEGKAEVPQEGTIAAWIKGDITQQNGDNIYPFGFYRVSVLGPGGNSSTDGRSGLITKKDGNNHYWGWGDQNIYDGNWHHYAVKWGSDNVTLYIDGQQVGNPKAVNGNIPVGESRKLISGMAWNPTNYGPSNSYGPHDGKIDEFRVFDRALSQGEIERLYRGVDTVSSGPIGSWWIEDNGMHWIDQDGYERAYGFEKIFDGSPGGSSGNAWMDSGKIHYIGQNGNERVLGMIFERFEDGNLNEWEVHPSRSSLPDTWQITSNSYEGSYAVNVGHTSKGGAIQEVGDYSNNQWSFHARKVTDPSDDFSVGFMRYSDGKRVAFFDLRREVNGGNIHVGNGNGLQTDTGVFISENSGYWRFVIKNYTPGGSFDWEIYNASGTLQASGNLNEPSGIDPNAIGLVHADGGGEWDIDNFKME